MLLSELDHSCSMADEENFSLITFLDNLQICSQRGGEEVSRE